ncbi:MAG: M23 family metallopeptidase [Clostridia bacterium]|nr:M23 family metallopeptidase [Clostridia bacterium]HBC85129.1 peptidase M23 [Clostridiales bacterium]
MRKEIDRKRNIQKAKMSKTLYTSAGIISLIVIIFAIGIFVYGNKNAESSKIADLSSSDITSLVEGGGITSKQAGSQIGKSVNEVKEESNTLVVDTEKENNSKKNEVQQIKEQTTTKTTNSKDVANKTKEKADEEEKTKQETKKADPVFSMPVEGEVIKEYAKDKLVYSDTLKEWVTHAGIDIKSEKTTIVKASEEGTVKSIKNDPRYGLTVVIEHNNGFSTVYSNLLTAEFVTAGESVKKGQTIGTVGNTATFEISDESHLHFEILKDNVQIDPNMYIK